jgi:hypothetical protein
MISRFARSVFLIASINPALDVTREVATRQSRAKRSKPSLFIRLIA